MAGFNRYTVDARIYDADGVEVDRMRCRLEVNASPFDDGFRWFVYQRLLDMFGEHVPGIRLPGEEPRRDGADDRDEDVVREPEGGAPAMVADVVAPRDGELAEAPAAGVACRGSLEQPFVDEGSVDGGVEAVRDARVDALPYRTA